MARDTVVEFRAHLVADLGAADRADFAIEVAAILVARGRAATLRRFAARLGARLSPPGRAAFGRRLWLVILSTHADILSRAETCSPWYILGCLLLCHICPVSCCPQRCS